MRKQQYEWVVGIDEVGRGPLAGPVTVCGVAVLFSHYKTFVRHARALGITDSKKLTPQKRTELARLLKSKAQDGSVRIACVSRSALHIDRQGIAVVIRKLVSHTLQKLAVPPEQTLVLLDGSLYAPASFIFQETVIKGDSAHEIIGAASIVAKVHRDSYMQRQHKKYPAYGFLVHKGYGTKAHREAIKDYGLCPLHRRSFCTRIDIA